MITKSVPSEVRDQPVILVPIVAIVGENDVRGNLRLERLEIFLNIGTEIRKETIPKVLNRNPFLSCSLQKKPGAFQRFLFPLSA